MLIYLYGPDSYRRGRKFKEILSAYAKRHALRDMLHVDLEEEGEEGWLRARDFLNQPSMFVESKLLTLREAGREAYADWSDVLERELTSEKTFVIISDSASPHKRFSFLLSHPAKAQEFGILKGAPLERFLSEEAKGLGISFAADAWRYFLRAVSSFEEKEHPEKALWRAALELRKIALQGRGEVSREALFRSLEFSETGNFYDIVRALLSGRSPAMRLSALEELISLNIDPARAFNTACYFAEGKDALFLAEADVAVKSGRLDYETALLSTALR